MLSRYEEAIAALKQAATLNPDFFLSHLFLAVSYSELARYAEAQAVVAELRRINPNFSVASAEKTYFSLFNDQTLVRRWTATLRKAGLE
jgi:tetratricopeptide (TPR) repeat protein